MIISSIKNIDLKQFFKVMFCSESQDTCRQFLKQTISIVTNKRTIAFGVVLWITYTHVFYLSNREYYKPGMKKLYYVIRNLVLRPPPPDNPEDEIAESKFFDADQVDCRKHVVAREPCESKECAYHKLNFLVDILKDATETIDLCMYLITCTDLAQALIVCHKRGVQVRVIVEEEMSTSSESKVQQLISAGIVVKSKVVATFMHHKFCVIDANVPYKRRLITGSLNWTLQGLAGNWENVILLSNKKVVLQFLTEFNYIWDYFEVKKLKSKQERISDTTFIRSDDEYDSENESDEDVVKCKRSSIKN